MWDVALAALGQAPCWRTTAGMTDGRIRARPRPMAHDTSARTGEPVYQQSIAGCLEDAIGRHGLSQAELKSWLDRLAPALSRLQDDYKTRRLPHLRIPEESADIEAAEAAFAKLCQGARAVIFFGTGGSSLGGQTLAQLGGWHIPGTADESQKKRPRTRFYDNLDGETLQSALGSFDDLGSARFVVISKSGGTPETLVQALAALDAVKAAGLETRIPELFLGVTEATGRGQGQRPAHAVRGARHSPARSSSGHRRAVFGADQRRAAGGHRPRARCARGACRRQERGRRLAGGQGPGRFRARARGGGGDRAGARAGHPGPGHDALFGPARAVLGLVRAAVGGEPRQERAGHSPPLPAWGRSISTASCSCSWTGRAST